MALTPRRAGFAGFYDARGAGRAPVTGWPVRLPPARGEGLAAGAAAGHCGPDWFVSVAGWLSNLDELAQSLGVARDPAAVVRAGYERDGLALLERLRGDFALVVWDRRAQRGVVARDPLGGHPLYVSAAGDRLAFATDLHALIALLPRRPDPDRVALTHWVAGRSARGGLTPYAGVRRVPPGGCVVLDGRPRQRRYWRPSYADPVDIARPELEHLLRTELADGVARAIAPGDRAAVLLSGGLDSATVAGCASRLTGRSPAAAYSAVFPAHPSVDESSSIETLTSSYGLRSVAVPVARGSMLDGALHYLRDWGLPLIAPNNFFLVDIARRAAADGATTLLDGEGGDVLFEASRYVLADRLRRGRLLDAVDLARRLPGAGTRPGRRAIVRLVATYGAGGALPARVGGALGALSAVAPRAERQAAPWLTTAGARLVARTARDHEWKLLDGPRWWAHLADAVTDAMDALDARGHLHRRARMAGLADRHPLLDAGVVGTALRLPPESALDPHLSRPLMRAAMRGTVPDEVRLRPVKPWFDEVIEDFLVRRDMPRVRALLLDPRAETRAYADQSVVAAELLDAPFRRDLRVIRRRATGIWRLVTAECWLRYQEDPDLPDRLLSQNAPP